MVAGQTWPPIRLAALLLPRMFSPVPPLSYCCSFRSASRCSNRDKNSSDAQMKRTM
ncbi:hypothetical protein C2S51_020996 [Perilla frutescens var. frutescens]|nr:hypothetical protein C2S51_020996 [Perilla frutescens var. frutescens]